MLNDVYFTESRLDLTHETPLLFTHHNNDDNHKVIRICNLNLCRTVSLSDPLTLLTSTFSLSSTISTCGHHSFRTLLLPIRIRLELSNV